MSDMKKPKEQLLIELAEMRNRVAELQALDSAREQAMAQVQSRADQISLIYETGQRLSGELELDTLLSQVVVAVRDAFDCYGAVLMLVDEETQLLTLQSIASKSAGVFPEDVSLAVGEGMVGRAAETGETQISGDVGHDSHYVRKAKEETRSELAAPIKSGQKIIGVLDLQSDELDAFGESDKVVMQALGTQIAIAIENARLFADAQDRTMRLAAVNRIAKVASVTLDVDVLMERVYQEIASTFRADAFFIALYDEEAGELDLRFVMDEGARQSSTRIPLGVGLSSVVVNEKRPLVLQDFEHQQQYQSQAVYIGTGKHPESWLGAPLLIGERVIGIISTQAYRPRAWGEEDEQLLLTIADQVAVAVENALLFQERERRATELAIVNELGRTITSTTKLDELLEIVHHQVGRLFNAANFCISTYEEASDEWTSAFFVEHGQVLPRSDVRRAGGTGLTGCMIRDRQPLRFQSDEEIAAFQKIQGMEAIGKSALSWMGVPLVVADRAVGGMAIQSYDRENLYDERDEALFSTIAAQVAPALNNLRLMEGVRRWAQEMQAINEVGQAITSVLDLDAVLRQIVDIVKARFGHYFVCIALMDGERLIYRNGSAIGDSDVRVDPGLWQQADLLQGSSMAAETARTEQPVLSGDVSGDLAYYAVEALPDTCSELCVPIKVKGRVIGTLDVQSERLFAYEQADVGLLQSLANQAGVAIENANLFDAARIRAEELTVLNELSQALTTCSSVEEVLQVAHGGACRLLDTVNFDIGLYNPAKDEIDFPFFTSESEIDSQITTIPASEGITGYVIRNRAPVLIPENVLEWMGWAGIEPVGEPALSWLGVPLIAGDHVLGSMTIQSFTTARAYGERERDLLAAIANQTAIALQNVRLYEAVEQELAERKRADEALQQAYAEVESQVEERTAELRREVVERERAQQDSARLQQEVIEAQKQAIQELSTPVIPVMERIIIMPLVGNIDSERARDITRALLAGIQEHRAKIVILDITGVSIVDSEVANHLNKTIQAARLKGAHSIVTGISDAVAETIVDLGIDWGSVETLGNLQTGLRVALSKMGRRIEG